MSVHALGASFHGVYAPLRTTQDTTLLLELVHADGRQAGRGVMAGRQMVNFMDGDGGVNDFRLDDLLLDQWLHGLVDMTGCKYQRLS